MRDEFRALVIEHERASPGGLVHRWLEERSADIDVFEIDVDGRHVDPRDYGLIFSLGSEFPAYDDTLPWLERERRLLADAIRSGVPIVGICFGGQLLARVMGGEVFRAEGSEIGWLSVNSFDSLVPPGPWFQWHFDTFRIPPGAVLIGESAIGPQAFRAGRSLGVQFHPEVTPEIMQDWVRVYRHELDADGVDPEALLVETEQRAESSQRNASRLLDTFVERVSAEQEQGDRGR